MVVDVLRLTRWEWFKLRKRWMPWILLGIIVVIAQLALWSAYLTYRNTDIGEEVKITTFGASCTACS